MSRLAVIASWEDAPHLSAEAKAELEAAYLPHERDARTKGIPSLGAGAIYPVPETDIIFTSLLSPYGVRSAYSHWRLWLPFLLRSSSLSIRSQ